MLNSQSGGSLIVEIGWKWTRQRCNRSNKHGFKVFKLKWEPHGVGLDRAPCGVVSSTSTTARANLTHGIESVEK